MFLNKYLDNFYYDMLYDNYDSSYLEGLDESNFVAVYNVFNKYNFYFINDIILNYIELFEMNCSDVESGILRLRDKLGYDFVFVIGNDMKYLNEIIDEELEDE